ncbi:MAG: TetR/AcrR family transcriptional regulator [Actinobacteria bacterium]|nr:TetR/AcrR family transcriptional regulator [Actinomycetota bacterium]
METAAERSRRPISRRGRGRPSQGARAALVAAARQLFTERDFEEVSTADLLARAGVSRGAMYHHFESKTDLFRAAWEESEREVMARLASAAAGSDFPFEALAAGCRAYLELCATSLELQRLGLRQSRMVLGWDGWSEAAAELGIGAMEAGVRAASDSGELETGDPSTTARLLLATLVEAGLLIASSPDPRARFEEVAPEALRFLEGLKAGPPRSPG